MKRSKAEIRAWRAERNRELPGGLAGAQPKPAKTEGKQKRVQVRDRRTGAVRPIAECGTISGYMRHRNLGETKCEACLEARRVYRRQQYAKNNPVVIRKRKPS